MSDNINDKPFDLNDYYLNFEKTSNICLSNADGTDAYGRSGYSDVLLNAIIFYKPGFPSNVLANIYLYDIINSNSKTRSNMKGMNKNENIGYRFPKNRRSERA